MNLQNIANVEVFCSKSDTAATSKAEIILTL